MIIHVGVSGGKDSTALLLWAVHESGYPKENIVASMCDTGNESPLTLEYVQMLSERVHPITILKPDKDFYELAKHNGRFPSAKARFCTDTLKMEPTRIFVKALRLIDDEIVLLSGVRGSESAARSLLPETEESKYFGAQVRRPLLNWSISDVWAMHRKYNIPKNPLYAMGCKRVGCFPCVMSRKSEIGIIAQRYPERIQFIKSKEEEAGKEATFAGMFHANTIPPRYRTKLITKKDGTQMMVATIEDVARWALNDPSLWQAGTLDLFDELESEACDNSLGFCE